MGSHLLSVIVPTRNRQYYAYRCIKHILSVEDSRIQLVIRDNSDDDSLQSMIIEFAKDNRLKYEYAPQRVSFVQNFSDALAMSDGEFICFIGDDDGINHEIVDFSEWMQRNQIDAAKPEILTFYRWPNTLNNPIIEEETGTLKVQHYTGKIRAVDTLEAVIEYLKGGCGDYLRYDLAKPYHGIVRRNIYEMIKTETGIYFGGLTPDIYGAIALSLLTTRAVAIDYPFTIPGECPQSGSADSRNGRHTGKLMDAPHFFGHDEYHWNPLVPAFYSVETIWSESALSAITDLKLENMHRHVNFGEMYFQLIRRYPEYKKELLQSYKEAVISFNRGRNRIWLQILQAIIQRIFRKCIHMISFGKNQALKTERVFVAQDIEAAASELSKYVMQNSQGINDLLKCNNLHNPSFSDTKILGDK